MDAPTPQPDRPTLDACPWCSTSVTPETITCPSCKAVLITDEEPVLPGVTAVDDKVVRGETRTQPRSRLLSWISGEYVEEAATPAESQAIAPPDPEVQREIRRLELEAEVANLQAEVEARRFEAVVDELEEAGDTGDAVVEGDDTAVAAGDAAAEADDSTDDAAAAPAPDALPTGAPAAADVAEDDPDQPAGDRPPA